MSSSEILWELKNLSNTASALYIAAHPDDENTRLISYLANERHVRTAYLSLTRGDGGQNLIGSEKGPLLGMVRTQELLAARRTDHGTQYFSRAYDFGYSKNPEETFRFWNKDSVLADAVWVIRTFKPDVIICRFPTTGEGGHGHHTASAIIAFEAFDAAADPKKFPEQLKYTTTWQAKRIVWNTFNFGGMNMTDSTQLKIDVGGYNSLLGKYNGEIAAESRSMHKSQGFGSEKSRGSQFEYFKHMKGAEAKDDLFDGVDMTWNRYSETKSLKKMIDQTINNYEYKPHDNFLSELMELYHAFQKISKNNKELAAQKHLKIALLERIILASSGVWADVTTSLQTIAPGQDVKVNISLIKSSKEPISVLNLKTFNNDTSLNLSLTDNKMERISQTVKVPLNTKQSTPYWLTTFPEKGLFQVHDLKQNTLAENATAATASILFKVMNDTFSTTIPIRYKTVDPVKGEQYQPLQIVPPIAINVSYNNYLFTNDKTKTIPVTIVSSTDSIKGVVSVNAPQGWDVKISNADFQLVGKGSQTIIPIAITPSKKCHRWQHEFVCKCKWKNLQSKSYHYRLRSHTETITATTSCYTSYS